VIPPSVFPSFAEDDFPRVTVRPPLVSFVVLVVVVVVVVDIAPAPRARARPRVITAIARPLATHRRALAVVIVIARALVVVLVVARTVAIAIASRVARARRATSTNEMNESSGPRATRFFIVGHWGGYHT
jgi:hypothetical protein|tara:strand:+ start:3797 stop:4186 length:390 start_codon:yes stop_codon:yes gene_type:complete